MSQYEIQKTALRLPRWLHESIHEAADKNGRSMNAEIVARLEQSFNTGQGLLGQAMIESEIQKMEERFEEMRKDLLDEV
ncbi:Arc family DNA-binding protein, partial [Arthrospira platensis SPKY1]|nr:Arc family DNA-binding protein [Arthrospira platensis SPKY1]